MNGSVNNTISPKQVDKLLGDFQRAVTEAKDTIETEAVEFFENFGRVWAGEDARKKADRLAIDFNSNLIDNLAGGFNYIARGVIDIANSYAKKAGKSPLAYRRIEFPHNINANAVKSEWDDGAFGFKQIPGKIAGIIATFDLFRSSVNRAANELADSIKSVNAFGNPEIKQALSDVCTVLTDIMFDYVKQLTNMSLDIVDEAAHRYNITSDQIASFFPTGGPYGLQTYYDVIDKKA